VVSFGPRSVVLRAISVSSCQSICSTPAFQLAKTQDALSWELRAATGMTRPLRDQHPSGEGPAILRHVYGRFTEGFDTADVRAARTMLEYLSA